MFAAAEFADERAYYKGALGKTVGTAEAKPTARATGPRASRSTTSPSRPSRASIGFMPVEGGGIHRIWYTGGRWAYASALIDGFTDYIFITIDMSDPTQAARGRALVDARHEPGRRRDADWPRRPAASACTTPIIHGDIAYCAWRDAGLVVLDVADRAKPEADRRTGLARRPSAAARTIACRCPTAICWSCSTRRCSTTRRTGQARSGCSTTASSPTRSASRPSRTPAEADYKAKGGHFGPHNIHENRPGSFVSSELIFATYQNAGVRVFDIRDPFAPRRGRRLVPPQPRG